MPKLDLDAIDRRIVAALQADGRADERGTCPACRSVPVAMSATGRVSRAPHELFAARNCTRDEGGPFEFGDQEPISSHRKLLRAKKSRGGVVSRRRESAMLNER